MPWPADSTGKETVQHKPHRSRLCGGESWECRQIILSSVAPHDNSHPAYITVTLHRPPPCAAPPAPAACPPHSSRSSASRSPRAPAAAACPPCSWTAGCRGSCGAWAVGWWLVGWLVAGCWRRRCWCVMRPVIVAKNNRLSKISPTTITRIRRTHPVAHQQRSNSDTAGVPTQTCEHREGASTAAPTRS